MVGLAVMDFLIRVDLGILKFLNVTLQHPYLDQFWLFVTQMHKSKLIMFTVVPALLGWLVYIYRWQVVKVLIALGIAIALADALSYRGIKKYVERPRPFQNQATASWLRKVGEAHGTSFPSNHAANCFAAAVVLSWCFRRSRAAFYTLATLVAVSRISLGVHYPSDVLAGAILGYFVGWLVTSELAKQFHVSKKTVEIEDWRSRYRRIMRR